MFSAISAAITVPVLPIPITQSGCHASALSWSTKCDTPSPTHPHETRPNKLKTHPGNFPAYHKNWIKPPITASAPTTYHDIRKISIRISTLQPSDRLSELSLICRI
jgi:hypothetical protein